MSVPLIMLSKLKNNTDGSLRNCSIGISPSRLCPDYTHCLRRIPRSDCDYVEVSLSRHTIFATRQQFSFTMQVFIARISSLYRKKVKVKLNTYRLGVLIVRLRYIGMYPFVTILRTVILNAFFFKVRVKGIIPSSQAQNIC